MKNMKTKSFKRPGEFPYQKYISKVGRHKFEADLYEDNGGQLIAKIGREIVICRADAKLEDWLDEAMEMSDFYHNLVEFLKEVKYLPAKIKKNKNDYI